MPSHTISGAAGLQGKSAGIMNKWSDLAVRKPFLWTRQNTARDSLRRGSGALHEWISLRL